MNKALSNAANVQKSDSQAPADLEPIYKIITQLSEQIIYLEETMTSEIMANRQKLEQH